MDEKGIGSPAGGILAGRNAMREGCRQDWRIDEKMFFLLKEEIGSQAVEGGVGEFGESAEVVEGGEAELLSAEVIDGFCLLVADIWMAL